MPLTNMQTKGKSIFHLSLNYYLHQIESQQSFSFGTYSSCSVKQSESKVGFYYLAAIVYEYLLIQIREQESNCKKYLNKLIIQITNKLKINSQTFNRLVYKIFFYKEVHQMYDEFIQGIKRELTKIRYNIEQIEDQTITVTDLDRTNHNKTTQSSQTTFDISRLSLRQQTNRFGTKNLNLSESRSIQYDKINSMQQSIANGFKRKCNSNWLNEEIRPVIFCGDQQVDTIEEYLNNINNPRSQISQLCHQIGLNNCQTSKVQRNKLFLVSCKLNITGKYTKNIKTVYEQFGEDKNSKLANTFATKRVLYKVYRNHPELWQDFKRIKSSKSLVT